MSHIEPVRASDREAVTALLDAAFAPSMFESSLVSRLRGERRTLWEWVVREQGELLAYIAYTLAYRGATPIGFHLAPLAVRPESQRRRLGAGLTKHTLAQVPLSASAVFVLGDPAYYGRFGFRRISTPVCPFDPGNEHFLALRCEESDETFEIGYEPEFLVV